MYVLAINNTSKLRHNFNIETVLHDAAYEFTRQIDTHSISLMELDKYSSDLKPDFIFLEIDRDANLGYRSLQTIRAKLPDTPIFVLLHEEVSPDTDTRIEQVGILNQYPGVIAADSVADFPDFKDILATFMQDVRDPDSVLSASAPFVKQP